MAQNLSPVSSLRIHVQSGHAAMVMRTAFSANDGVLASADEDGQLRLWDVGSGAEFGAYALKGKPTALALGKEPSFLAAAAKNGEVAVWDVRSEQRIALPAAGVEPLHELIVDEANLRLFGAATNALFAWSLKSGEFLYRRDVNTLEGIALSSDGKQLAMTAGNIVETLEAASGKTLHASARFLQADRNDKLSGIAWDVQDRLVFEHFPMQISTLSGAKHEIDHGTCNIPYPSPDDEVKEPFRGHWLYSNVRMFSTRAGAVLAAKVSVSPGEMPLVFLNASNCAVLREVRRDSPSLRDDPYIDSVSVSPSGNLAAYARFGTIYVARLTDVAMASRRIDIDDAELAFSTENRMVTNVQLADNGRKLYVNHTRGRYSILDLSRSAANPLTVRGDSTDGDATGSTLLAAFRPVDAGHELVLVKQQSDANILKAAFFGFRTNGRIERYALPDGRKLPQCEFNGSPIYDFTLPFLSEDGTKLIAIGKPFGMQDVNAVAIAYDTASCNRLWRSDLGGEARDVKASKDGNVLLLRYADGSLHARLRNGEVKKLVLPQALTASTALAVSPDGRLAAVAQAERTLTLFDLDKSTPLLAPKLEMSAALSRLQFTPSGLLVVTLDGSIIELGGAPGSAPAQWKVTSRMLGGSEAITSVIDSESPPLRFGLSANGAIILWKRVEGDVRPLAVIKEASEGRWVSATESGLFDSNSLDSPRGLAFKSPQWLGSVPLEALYRTSYEPNLLARLLAGEALSAKGVDSKTNFLQPRVKSIAIARDGVASSDSGAASVIVKIEEGRRGTLRSGVHDLHLSADGRRLGRRAQGGMLLAEPSGESREAWRKRTQIQTDAASGEATVIFPNVRWPQREGAKEIEFSAYAFNEDQVKGVSQTSRYKIPADVVPRKGRAYVVTFGVDQFESNSLNSLSYAANDARGLAARLGTALAALRNVANEPLYESISSVVLVAEHTGATDTRFATKQGLREVLRRLSGADTDAASLKGVVGAELLQPLIPEDLLIVAISTHGLATADGEFYLMPHDTGNDEQGNPVLSRTISSSEISAWLGELAAGEIVLIIDACQSAGALQSETFKPGPLGNHGLGQLAYDKGMRVIAASLRQQYSVEAASTQHGLLSYVLIHSLDKEAPLILKNNGETSISEWLRFAEKTVPELHERLRTQALEERTLQLKAYDPKLHNYRRIFSGNEPVDPTQKPVLFDYYRQPSQPTR